MKTNNTTLQSIATDVAELHNAAGVYFPSEPTLSSKDDQALSISLLREELREYEKALKEGNLVAAVDALGDLQTVLVRAMWKHGVIAKMPAVMKEIHRSNMSKISETMWDAQETVDHYTKHEVIETNIYSAHEGKFAVIRLDGKILKDKNWSPPNIKDILYGEEKSNTEESAR